MTEHDDEERVKKMLQEALPPVAAGSAPERDLWPAMLRRMEAGRPARKPIAHWTAWAWFDCALLAGLVGVAALFPSAIPMLLYYL